jgi:NhaP-type Na+/H+ or K+/H+ antiporter
VFVIVLFSVLVRVASGEAYAPAQLLALPSAILLGLAGGIAIGWVLSVFFTKVHIRDTGKVVIILSLSFMLVELEQTLQGAIGFSGLLAVMAAGTVLHNKKLLVSRRLSSKFSKLWVAAELLLFVLVGAAVDIRFAVQAGFAAVVLILLAAAIRFFGIQVCCNFL